MSVVFAEPSPHKVYLPSLTSSQATKHHTNPEIENSLLPVASLSPETVSLVPFNLHFPSSYRHQSSLPNSINGCSLVFLKLPNCRRF